jgi:hypothetical protein
MWRRPSQCLHPDMNSVYLTLHSKYRHPSHIPTTQWAIRRASISEHFRICSRTPLQSEQSYTNAWKAGKQNGNEIFIGTHPSVGGVLARIDDLDYSSRPGRQLFLRAFIFWLTPRRLFPYSSVLLHSVGVKRWILLEARQDVERTSLSTKPVDAEDMKGWENENYNTMRGLTIYNL